MLTNSKTYNWGIQCLLELSWDKVKPDLKEELGNKCLMIDRTLVIPILGINLKEAIW